MIFPSSRPQKRLARGPETGVFPWVENSLIPPQLTGQFNWPVFDAK
jgi:hypothetical protein